MEKECSRYLIDKGTRDYILALADNEVSSMRIELDKEIKEEKSSEERINWLFDEYKKAIRAEIKIEKALSSRMEEI